MLFHDFADHAERGAGVGCERAVLFEGDCAIDHDRASRMLGFIIFSNERECIATEQPSWRRVRTLRVYFSVSNLIACAMVIHPDELRNIEELIRAGEKRISEQQERIARLEQEGSDATPAREMLVILQNSQGLLISRRNLLLRQS